MGSISHLSQQTRTEATFSFVSLSAKMDSVKSYVFITAMTAIVLVVMIEDCSGFSFDPHAELGIVDDYNGKPCDVGPLLEGVNGQLNGLDQDSIFSALEKLAENIARCQRHLVKKRQ